MNVVCPSCGELVKNPVCRLAGVSVYTHRNRRSDERPYCSLVVVVERDFGEPRVVSVDPAKQTIEAVMQAEAERLLAQRVA